MLAQLKEKFFFLSTKTAAATYCDLIAIHRMFSNLSMVDVTLYVRKVLSLKTCRCSSVIWCLLLMFVMVFLGLFSFVIIFLLMITGGNVMENSTDQVSHWCDLDKQGVYPYSVMFSYNCYSAPTQMMISCASLYKYWLFFDFGPVPLWAPVLVV